MIDMQAELENWARLVRTGRITHFCGSAEKFYRAPAENIDMDGDAPDPPAIPLRVREGWAVEFAWRQLPSINVRLLVSWHYIRNRSIEEAARKAKVARHKAEHMLQQARQEMRMRLITGRVR